jgi:ABC-2 type transport system ATP-binding protein
VVSRGRLVDYDTLSGLIAKHLPGRQVTLEDITFLEEIYSKLVEGPAAAAAALADLPPVPPAAPGTGVAP